MVESNRVKISMEGKDRWTDMIPMERWFRTLKFEEVYLKDYTSSREANREIGKLFQNYNCVRIHSAFDEAPAHWYYPALLYSMLADKGTSILDTAA